MSASWDNRYLFNGYYTNASITNKENCCGISPREEDLIVAFLILFIRKTSEVFFADLTYDVMP